MASASTDGRVFACYAYLQSFPLNGCGGVEVQVAEALQAHGITVLQTMPCDDTTLGITILLADEGTIAWVTSHYPPVKVAGWLRPLPSGP